MRFFFILSISTFLTSFLCCQSSDKNNDTPPYEVVNNTYNDSTILKKNRMTTENTKVEVMGCQAFIDSLRSTSIGCKELWSKTIKYSFVAKEDCPLVLLDTIVKVYASEGKYSDYKTLECFASFSDGYITEMFVEHVGYLAINNFSSLSDDMLKYESDSDTSYIKDLFFTKYNYFDDPKIAIELVNKEIKKTKSPIKKVFLEGLLEGLKAK